MADGLIACAAMSGSSQPASCCDRGCSWPTQTYLKQAPEALAGGAERQAGLQLADGGPAQRAVLQQAQPRGRTGPERRPCRHQWHERLWAHPQCQLWAELGHGRHASHAFVCQGGAPRAQGQRPQEAGGARQHGAAAQQLCSQPRRCSVTCFAVSPGCAAACCSGAAWGFSEAGAG